MRRIAVIAVAALSGCAALPEDIEPVTVSSSKFDAYSCEQITTDIQLFEPELYDLALDQTEARQFDQGAALMFGVTPTMMGQGQNRDLRIAQLRGDLSALRAEGAEKKCTLPPEHPRLQDALAGKVWRTPAEKAAREKRG